MANNYKVKTYSNSATGTSQALFTASASTTLIKSILVNCDKTTPNVNAILRIKKSGGAEKLIKKQNITVQNSSYEMLYDVLPLESGDAVYAQSDDTDIVWIVCWVENTTVQNGQSIDFLSDVDTSGKANGDVLTWNSTTSNWEAEAPGAAAGNAFGTILVATQSAIVADSTSDTLSIAAGTGISLTTDAASDTLTITNTVTAPNTFGAIAVNTQSTLLADSTADTLTLVAGTGISITTDAAADSITITNSATGANAFGNVAVTGYTTVAADSTNDTMTFAPAGGMTITTDATTDTVTFDSARLDDDDVTLSGIREIDLNGENLNFRSSGFDILLVEADGVSMTDPVIRNYTGGTGGKITLTEATTNGGSSITIKAPDSLTVTTNYTLPSADGTSGQVLATNAAGGLSWTTRAANSFETIAVAGQSSIVADTHTDTLTIAAGSGITLTTNAGTDTLTIAATTSGPSYSAVRTQSGTSYTLAATDAGAYILTSGTTTVTITVPPQSSVTWAADTEIYFEQNNTGQIAILAGSGVTVNSSETLKTAGRYSVIALKRVASDTWTLTGERQLA